MTGPQPIIIQKKGFGRELQEALAPVQRALQIRREFQQREKALTIERERFELDKMRAVKAGELTDEQVLNLKAERRATELKLKTDEEALEGAREGSNLVSELAMDLEARGIQPGSDEFQGLVAETRAKTDNPSAHLVIDSFAETQLSQEAVDAQIDATRRGIEIANEQLELSQAQEGRAQATSQLVRNATVIQEATRSGITFGQAADLLQVEIPAELRDINPASLAAGGRRGTEMQQRASVFLTMMGTSIAPMEATLQEIEEKGGLNLITDALARTNPKSFWGNIFTSALNSTVPEEQKAVISYMRNFVASWQYFASGAQINEGEYARLVDAVFPRSTDGERARQAKRAMRTTTIKAIEAMALGDWTETPVDPMFSALTAMSAQAAEEQWPVNLRRVIEEALDNTKELRRNLLNPNKTVILNNTGPPIISPEGEVLNPEGSFNMPSDMEGVADAILGNPTRGPTQQTLPAGTVPPADSLTVFDLQHTGGR